MLRASIALMDDSVLIEDAEILARDARRGTGDGHVWRGAFLVPGPRLKPTIGETIHLRFDERSLVAAVVTQIEGSRVHFRARGKAPVQKDPAVLQGEGASAESAQSCRSGSSPPCCDHSAASSASSVRRTSSVSVARMAGVQRINE